jgi:MFS family permease
MKRDFNGTVSEQSELYTWFKSVAALSAISGPFVTKGLLLVFSRRVSCFWISLSGVVFWLLFFAVDAQRLWLGIIIRGLLGVTIGAFSALTPMYIVEISPQNLTAFFGSIHQLCIATGLVMIYVLAGSLNWRFTAVVGAGICGILCGLVWFVPEPTLAPSPGDDYGGSKQETIFSSRWLWRVILSILLMLFQQLSGVNAILTNLDEIFQKANITIPESYASALTASAQMLACLFAGAAMQKFGRKIVWIFSFAGIAITDILYGVTEVPAIKGSMGPWMPIILIFSNLFCFGAGAGPIPWFLIPEMFNEAVRATGMLIGTASNWILAFAVIQFFDVMSKPSALGMHGSFFFYGGASSIAVVFGVLFVQTEGPQDVDVLKSVDELPSETGEKDTLGTSLI